MSANLKQIFFFVYLNVAMMQCYTPIVLWHGMGDSCCFKFSMGHVQKELEKALPGVYIYSVRIGDNIYDDVYNSYFGNANEQVQAVCEMLGNDPNLSNGYNAVGFSQGGQLLRALAQTCPTPVMRNLISVGGQHQGVYGVPHCGALSSPVCNTLRSILDTMAYTKSVQNHLLQATYWHDPMDDEAYAKGSIFLARINCEYPHDDCDMYAQNLNNLENMVLLKFDNDTMVYPAESEWFGFYKRGSRTEIEDFRASDLYNENRLGLQSMDTTRKIQFISVPGDHLQIPWSTFESEIIDPFLRN